MASRNSEGMVNIGSLAAAYSKACIASLTTSVTTGDDGSFTAESSCKAVGQGLFFLGIK
jgi:hypothetical protein